MFSSIISLSNTCSAERVSFNEVSSCFQICLNKSLTINECTVTVTAETQKSFKIVFKLSERRQSTMDSSAVNVISDKCNEICNSDENINVRLCYISLFKTVSSCLVRVGGVNTITGEKQDSFVCLDPVSNLQLFSLKPTEDYWNRGNWKLGRDKTKLIKTVHS